MTLWAAHMLFWSVFSFVHVDNFTKWWGSLRDRIVIPWGTSSMPGRWWYVELGTHDCWQVTVDTCFTRQQDWLSPAWGHAEWYVWIFRGNLSNLQERCTVWYSMHTTRYPLSVLHVCASSMELRGSSQSLLELYHWLAMFQWLVKSRVSW